MHRLVSDTELFRLGLIGSMHTGLDSKYNLSHKIHYGRKQQLTRILLFGSPCKQCIDPCGIEQILQHATRHHTDRSLCNKRLEHLAQRNRHLCASLQESPSPSGRYNITKKHQHLGRAGLERVCTSYLLFLMVVTTKHSLEQAARFSGLHTSLFSKLLQSHSKVAITTLEHLSKTQSRQFAKALQRLDGLPWKIVILIDSTLQHRASLHQENAKTFNHGKGYVIGHQWTNIVLILGDMLIPLRPIPFYSKRYCQTHELKYQSEHELMRLAIQIGRAHV